MVFRAARILAPLPYGLHVSTLAPLRTSLGIVLLVMNYIRNYAILRDRFCSFRPT
nr:hypothetical protein Q903MT_gene5273 [Picea sitchensis]